MPSYVTLLLTPFSTQFFPSSRKENKHILLQIASVLLHLSIDRAAVLHLHVLWKLADFNVL